MQLILSYNEVAVLRYTYCSILGFMASVREDLVLGFLVALNLVLGGFLGAVSEKPGDVPVCCTRGASPLIVCVCSRFISPISTCRPSSSSRTRDDVEE